MTRMKESGIDWIGQIPEEWEVSKLEHYVDIFGRIGFRGYTTNDIVNEGEGAISYSPSNIIDYSVIDNNNTYISWSKYDESPEIQIKTGDVLYVKTGSSYGKTGIVNKLSNKATINPQLVVLKPKKNTDSRLINYFLNSSVGKEQSELIVGGSTIPTITQESIKKMIFPKISFEEQQKIADFLDKKTAQLNKVKNLLEEQIQKLKDYRASLIYETVTKGLDKTVPMKDSGIDWIGQVPEGWGVKPLKYLASYDDETLTQSEINSNRKIDYVDISSVEFTKGINGHQEFSTLEAPSRARKIAKKGDTIISTVRTYLKAIAYVNNDYIVSTGFCVVRPKKINSKYLNYTIMSDSFTGPVSKYAWGVSYPAISSSQLVNIPIPFPESIEEQLSIVDYLDHKMLQLNKLIDIKQEQIENINKQRQTLIYDYVTGKRRV